MKKKGKKIMANVWGAQKPVFLTTWSEIKKLGFQLRQRAFGTLNDGTQALYFQVALLPEEKRAGHRYEWYLTTETEQEIKDGYCIRPFVPAPNLYAVIDVESGNEIKVYTEKSMARCFIDEKKAQAKSKGKQ